VGAVSAFIMAVGAIAWMHHMFAAARSCSAPAPSACSTPRRAGGGRDQGSPVQGDHTRVVQISHRYGMILFIASE